MKKCLSLHYHNHQHTPQYKLNSQACPSHKWTTATNIPGKGLEVPSWRRILLANLVIRIEKLIRKLL